MKSWPDAPVVSAAISAHGMMLVPGCVSVRHGHGFGHWAMGSVAKGKGAHSNNLMDTHTNPITGANCYNECKVRVRPAV